MTLNENAQWWVEELRSGKYNQTAGSLQYEHGFCCLGVACQLYEQDTGETLPRDPMDGYYVQGELDNDFSCVKEWLGLTEVDGHFFTNEGESECLVELNDAGYEDFEDLADIIESKPLGLFK